MINNQTLVKLLCELISCKAVTGDELKALILVESFISKTIEDLKVVKIPVTESRYSLLFYKTKPTLILTTHIDVVPAPDRLFNAQINDDKIEGRGSLDAQGILVSMIGAFSELINKNLDVGLLIVVGEETNGIGAKTSATELIKYSPKYLINGEPTELKLATGHKGIFDFEISFTGKNAHSGYPELGDDANQKLLYAISEILKFPRNVDKNFGETTINIGQIIAGTAANIISDNAKAKCCIRLATKQVKELEERLTKIAEHGTLKINVSYDPINLKVVSGFETIQVSYGTDVPNFSEINSGNNPTCEFLLFGPGTITRAHTDFEYITIPEIVSARESYTKLSISLLNNTFN